MSINHREKEDDIRPPSKKRRSVFGGQLAVTLSLAGLFGTAQNAKADEPVPVVENQEADEEDEPQDEKQKAPEWSEEQLAAMKETLATIEKVPFEIFQSEEGLRHGTHTIKVLKPGKNDKYGIVEFDGKKWMLKPMTWMTQKAKSIHFHNLERKKGGFEITVAAMTPLNVPIKKGRILNDERTAKLLCQLCYGTRDIPLKKEVKGEDGKVVLDENGEPLEEETGVSFVLQVPKEEEMLVAPISVDPQK